jgi:prophage antirepressor-like protein
MQNEIKIFEFEKHDVETVFLNGEPLFNPLDVGKCLGMVEGSIRNFISRMDEDERIKIRNSLDEKLTGTIKKGDMGLWLREPGLYRLIFKSTKPEAERFRRWVTHEVLPSLRKTGSYELNEREIQLKKLSDNFCQMVEENYGIKVAELSVLQDESYNKRLANLIIDSCSKGLGRINNLYNMLFDAYYEETGVDVPAIAEGRGVERKYYIKTHPVLAKSLFDFAQHYFNQTDRMVQIIPLDQSRLDLFQGEKGL